MFDNVSASLGVVLDKDLPGVNRTSWPSFQFPILENMGVVLYNKGHQMIEQFIQLQLIQVLTPGSNLINFCEDQKEVGVRTSISH